MKNKVKGLVIGALLGSMVAATAAYASGTQIEVFVRPLTYIFNGTMKKPTDGDGFIYRGSAYVPLRFIAESMGKEVSWDEHTGTIGINDPKEPIIIATYIDGNKAINITNKMIDRQIFLNIMYHPTNAAYVDDKKFREAMMYNAATQLILEGRMSTEQKEKFAAEAPGKLQKIKDSYYQASYGEQWEKWLQEMGVSESDMLEYIRISSMVTAYLETMVSEEEIKKTYDNADFITNYVKASWRQILIGFTDSSGKKRSKEDALERAQEVQRKLTEGEDFSVLAADYSDDRSFKWNSGQHYESLSMPIKELKKALMNLDIGTVWEIVETEFGYYVIQVQDRKVPTYEELRSTLKSLLLEKANSQWIDVDLPKLRVKLNDTDDIGYLKESKQYKGK